MSAHSLRTALALLQDDPDSAAALETLSTLATTGQPDVGLDEALRLLAAAHAGHEARREWDTLVSVIRAELALTKGTGAELAHQVELARVLDRELIEDKPAIEAWERVLQLSPGDDDAKEALERLAGMREKSKELVKRYVAEVELSTDPAFKSALLMSAAEVAMRFGGKKKAAVKQLAQMLEQATTFDPKNRRAAILLERLYRREERWDDAARVITALSQEAETKEERVAALLRLARLHKHHSKDEARAADAYEAVLDLAPGQTEALEFLAHKFSESEQWDHLVALYEDQWKNGGVKDGDELGVLVQVAMTHWRMRKRPDSAEPWFERVRKLDAGQPMMLSFFRDRLLERGDRARLVTILQDAQRALPEGPERGALAQEIAQLAEDDANAGKAIEQYKAILRGDPENQEARSALRRLYTQTESWNALVELLRQEIERLPPDDKDGRLSRLREIATIYRVHIKSDTALVTVLSQIVHLDETDRGAIVDLVRVYEALGRFRDLLTYQQKLAALTDDPLDKMELYRAIANRWLDQFNNVANAIEAFEGILAVEPQDAEALAKLRELYGKRRAWKELFELSSKELVGLRGPDRVPLLLEMAKLAAERLDRGKDAIQLWREALSLDPSAQGALDAMEKQAEREKDYETLAEALELRVEASKDDAQKLAALTKQGTLFAERLGAHDRAARAFRRVLDLQPGNAKALRVLRDSFLAAGDLDALEELYGSQGDWEGLADVLSSAADKAPDDAKKISLSLRAAGVFEGRIGQPERAARSYERILAIEPTHETSVRALVPLYENEERHGRLVALYGTLVELVPSLDEKLDVLASLVRSAGKAGDKGSMQAAAKRAVELAPGDPRALDLLAEAAKGTGDHASLAAALEARLADGAARLDDAETRDLRGRLVDLYAGEMGQLDKAVALLRRAVERHPDDERSIERLDALLRRTDRRDELRWLFELRVGRADDKVALLSDWATLEEDAFDDRERAAALFGRVVELAPDDRAALASRARLFRSLGDALGASGALARLRDLSEGPERARLGFELAELLFEPLGEAHAALDCVLDAMTLDPSADRGVALLEKLAKLPETQARAAEALVETHAHGGDARKEAEALRALIAAGTDDAQRITLTLRLADVQEHKLRSPGAAFDVLLQAVASDPEELALWDRAIELSSPTGRATDVAESLRVAMMGTLSPDAEVSLAERAAAVFDDRLGNPEAAIPYLDRVLTRRPDDETAFARLKQVLTSTERWGQLEELYEKVVAHTEDRGRQAELLSEVALICEEITQENGKAISYYERILELDPTSDATARSLDALYVAEKRWPDLARLLERRLPDALGDTAATLRLRLARLFLSELHVPDRATSLLGELLAEDPKSDEGRDLAEQLLAVDSQRLAAAVMLEGVYEARDDARDLARVLDIRTEKSTDPAERRELLRRGAALRDERLKDDQGAFGALSELVPLDPEDHTARERLIDIGRRLGAHADLAAVLARAAASAEPTTKAEILMKVASIYEDHLGDRERAIATYEAVAAIAPTDAEMTLPAARGLITLLAQKGDSARLASVLERSAKLEHDPAERRALLGRLGELAETQLQDDARAIAAWTARHEDDASDLDALIALERLHERGGHDEELIAVLRMREQAELGGDAKRRTLGKLAERLVALGRHAEAIDTYRALTDEIGASLDVQAALSRLYERTGRHTDLAESLETELDLAADAPTRVGLLVRLAAVRRAHLEDTEGALTALRDALTLDASSQPARDATWALLDDPSAQRDAAELLHPLLEADGDFQRLLRVLSLEADLADSDGERLALLGDAVRTAEGPLGDIQAALGFAFRGLRASLSEGDVSSWVDRAEGLARKGGDLGRFVNEASKIVPDVLDEEPRVALCVRIASVARGDLGDRALARSWFERALELRPEDRDVLLELERLHEEAGAGPELLVVLERRAELAESDDERRALLYRQAKLVQAQSGASDAIRVYESILDLGLDAPAVDTLYALYEAEGRHEDLTALLERQIAEEAGPKAPLFVRLARVYAERLGDVDRAFDQLEAALADTMDDDGAVKALEKLMADGSSAESRGRAAELLEPVYARRGDFKAVLASLEARLPSTQDLDERKALLRRIGTIHEEQADSPGDALEAFARLFAEDLSDRDTRDDLERVARVGSRETRLAEVYAAALDTVSVDEEHTRDLAVRTGELFAAAGRTEESLRAYRRALAFAPEDRAVFDAIDRLLTAGSRHEERAALYRAFLEQPVDDETKVSLLRVLARVEEQELGDRALAVLSLRRLLDVDDRDEEALDALTRLYRATAAWRPLAELTQQRAEGATDPEVAAAHRLSLARLYHTELADPESAVDQLEAIVEAAPWNKAAIAELEELAKVPELHSRVVEILLPLYERSDDVDDLVRVRRQKLALATEPSDKVTELLELATILETRKADRPAAFEAIQAAFALDIESGEVRQQLDRLAAEIGAWDALAASYEAGIGRADDLTKRDLLSSLAKLHDERRDDPRSALVAYGRLYELDPSDLEPLEAMDQLAMMLSDWTAVVDVLTKKAALVVADDERASLYRRVGEAQRDMLEDAPGAIASYERALELDPESPFTLDCLIELHEPGGVTEHLVALYRRRVEFLSTDDADAKYELLVKIAHAEEAVFHRNREAIEALREALSARPADSAVLASLDALYRKEELWADLLDNLRLRAASADTQEARVTTRRAMGDLFRDKLEDPREALECYRLVLDEVPGDAATIQAVLGLGDAREDFRREAVELLEPVLRATGSPKLIDTLELRLRMETDPEARARTLRNIALTHEHTLGDPKAALRALLATLMETPADDSLHDEIERLAASTSGYAIYADALDERARALFDADVASRLRSRLGRVAEEKLGDEARAITAYRAALDEGGDAPHLLVALDRLYEKAGDAAARADILERRASIATSDGERAQLYAQLGVLQVERLADARTGLASLRLALEADPTEATARQGLLGLLDGDHFDEAAEALQTAYRVAGDHAALTDLLEKKIERTPSASDRLAMRLDLARVLEEDRHDALRAQRVLEVALVEAPTDATVLADLERLGPVTGDWRGLASAIEKAISSPDVTAEHAKELLVRAAAWCRDRGGDAEQAERLFELALTKASDDLEILAALESLQRAPGRERALVETLRKRATLEPSADERRRLRREAKALSDHPLADPSLSLTILEEVLAENGVDLWALEELTTHRESQGDRPAVAKLLERRADIVDDRGEASALRHRAATLHDEELGDKEKAIALYVRLADDDVDDARATDALTRLYKDGGKHVELARLLERLVAAARSAEDRTRLRLDLARLSSETLQRPDDAIAALRAILDEAPEQPEAVTSLLDLFETTRRDDDLAELLSKQIDLAKARGDHGAELAYLVRLGDIYDTRLGLPEKAIATFEGVLARDPDHKGALSALARLLEARGDLDGAYAKLDRLGAIGTGEDGIALALRAADLATKRKVPADVRASLERALALDDTNGEVRRRLRAEYEAQAAFKELAAMLEVDAGRAATPEEKVPLLQRAASFLQEKAGDARGATRLLEAAAALLPDDREVLLTLSDAYTASGDSERAIATLERVRDSFGGKRSKELGSIHQRIAQAHLAAGAKDKALAELDAAFKIDPGNVATLRDLGKLTLEAGDLERAGKTYRALLLQKIDATSPITKAEVFFRLGEIHHKQGDKTKAIQMLERAIENDQGLEEAKTLLAQLKG